MVSEIALSDAFLAYHEDRQVCFRKPSESAPVILSFGERQDVGGHPSRYFAKTYVGSMTPSPPICPKCRLLRVVRSLRGGEGTTIRVFASSRILTVTLQSLLIPDDLRRKSVRQRVEQDPKTVNAVRDIDVALN